MNKRLINKGMLYGDFLCERIKKETNKTETLIIYDFKVEKTVDKDVWVGSNINLKYTITITNDTTISIKNARFDDKLDNTLIKLVKDSVFVNGSEVSYEYDDDTGLLMIHLGDITPGQTKITFDVKRII